MFPVPRRPVSPVGSARTLKHRWTEALRERERQIYGSDPEFFSPYMFFSRPEDPEAGRELFFLSKGAKPGGLETKTYQGKELGPEAEGSHESHIPGDLYTFFSGLLVPFKGDLAAQFFHGDSGPARKASCEACGPRAVFGRPEGFWSLNHPAVDGVPVGIVNDANDGGFLHQGFNMDSFCLGKTY